MIEICHVDLDRIETPPAGSTPGTLFVFWSAQRPVGQVYVSRAVDRAELAALGAAALERAGLREREPLPPPTRMRTSVVICTRGRSGLLERCLGSLAGQILAPDELIVVDNGEGADGTRRVVEQAGARYVREPRPGLDLARNTGARATTGDIVAYTDDDVVLHPHWLERLVAAFDPDIAGVTGLVLPLELATPAQCIFERHWGFGRGFQRIDFGPEFFATGRVDACPVWKIGAGANMAFRRQVFERVGLFDERLDAGAAGCSGDSEFWHRMLWRGLRIRYTPSAVVFHEHRRERPELARQIFAYARGHVAALLIQNERTGHRGNLKRALVGLPLYYLRRLVTRPFRRSREADAFLWQEIGGWVSGILFYARTRRRGGTPAERLAEGAGKRSAGSITGSR